MFSIYNSATEFFNQWDLNQKVTEPSLVVGDKVIFRNSSGMTYPMKAYAHDGAVVADVPNALLTMCVPVLVYINDRRETRTSFNVVAQEKPVGYVCVDNDDWPSDNVIDTLVASGQIGGIEKKNIVCFPEAEFSFSSGVCVGIAGDAFEDGDTVTVTYDGVKYERKAAIFPYEEFSSGHYVGNISALGGEDTGEPFAILATYDDDTNEFRGFIVLDVNEFGSEDDSTHRVGCSTTAETIKPIDPKYLVKEIDLPQFVTDYGGSSSNLTLNDLVLGLVNESAQGGGTLKETGYFACEGFRKAVSTTQQIVMKMATPAGSSPRFALDISMGNGYAVGASGASLVYMGYPMDVKLLFVFVDNPDNEKVSVYIQATVLS